MESIGSRLRSAREAKGISIEQAQKDTRISGKILIAMENDRAEEMISGSIYVKSFIKKYASYLGLDGAGLADGYTSGKSEFREQISVLNKEGGSFNFPLKKIIFAVIAIVLLAVGVKLIALAGSRTVAFFKSRPAAPKKAPAAASKPVIPQIPKADNLTLSIKTRADAYLKIKADGSVIYDGVLKKGSSETWKAKNVFEISTSRAEAVSADLNGVSLGSLGKGVVKGLKLPK